MDRKLIDKKKKKDLMRDRFVLFDSIICEERDS